MMSTFSYFRSLIRPFLKGRLLWLWLHFKTSRFAGGFARFLIANCKKDFSEPHHPDKRREIAHAGQQHAASEHTWEERFHTVLSQPAFDLRRLEITKS